MAFGFGLFRPKPKVESKVELTAVKCELNCGCAGHIVHSSTSVRPQLQLHQRVKQALAESRQFPQLESSV